MRRSNHRAGTGADTPPALSRLALLLAAGLSGFGVPAAQAQVQAQAAAAPEAAREDKAAEMREKREQLDTVTVTATRRREPVRDVPRR